MSWVNGDFWLLYNGNTWKHGSWGGGVMNVMIRKRL